MASGAVDGNIENLVDDDVEGTTMSDFREELRSLINRQSRENISDTPDFILAKYLNECLAAFDSAVIAREHWYGRKVGNGVSILEKR